MRIRPAGWTCLAAFAALLAERTAASAQRPALGAIAESARLTPSDAEATGSSWLGLVGRLDRARWAFDTRAAYGSASDGAAGFDLSGTLRAATPAKGRLGLFAEIRGRDASLLAPRIRSFGTDVRLAWNTTRSGVYLSGDAGRDSPAVPVGESSLGMGLGGWHAIGDVVVSLGVTERGTHSSIRAASPGWHDVAGQVWNDTTQQWVQISRREPNSDSGAVVNTVSWREMTATLQWWRPWLALSARGGVRLVPAREARAPWADVEATVPISRRIAAVAVGGWQPVASLVNDHQARFLAFGLRILPPVLRHRPLPLGVVLPPGAISIADAGSSRLVRVRAPLARMVELSGDFTGWRPMALEASIDGQWSLQLPIAPGTYRVSVRIDGGRWTAPPGTPRVADDFGGESGIVVVK
jgi:hypothetical protein